MRHPSAQRTGRMHDETRRPSCSGHAAVRLHRVFHVLAIVLGAGLALATVGAVYQALATERDRKAYPPPGRLVDVGGYRPHLQALGADRGGPTVVLDGGHMPSPYWGLIQPELARFTEVVAYDHAGLGWSEPGPQPRDARQLAAELHALLHNAGVLGPYVLVGHSDGGLTARMFAELYADEVAGMALLDAAHEDLFQLAGGAQTDRTQRVVYGLAPALARVGLFRLLIPGWLMGFEGLPSRPRAELTALANQPGQLEIIRDEWQLMEATHAEVRGTRDLGTKPLAVLSATQWEQTSIPGWARLQDALAELSANSEHTTIGGTHGFPADPAYTSQVVETVRRVVEAARTGQPLARANAN